MKWSSKLPNRAGYYWYIGPVLKRDFDRVANGSDIRDCTWGPIIAGVGICLKEIPSGDGNIHHEKMWEEGRIVVEFYGSTVRRTLAEMPKDVFWAGPIAPPISDWAWHLQPKNKVQAKPFESEIDASEMTAWSEALIWTRNRHTNTLRSALREYYPAALVAFDDLADRDALAVLGRAPTPAEGARLSLAKIRSALKAAGRQRNLDARALQIQEMLRSEQLTAPAAVSAAFGATTRAAVSIIIELNHQISGLEAELATHFEAHPDADIYRSLPGLGVVLGARVLGEFGDDPTRYTTAKSRKNYAGTSPLTVASGKKRAVLARHVRNRRLYDAIDQWAFCAITRSPGARAYYDQHRAAGDLHHQALRAVGNRFVGILHGCLRHHTTYDEHTAWSHRHNTPTTTAA